MKALLHGIYGGRRSGTSFLMTSSLARLALLSGTTEEELLDRHTMFPYAVAFMREDERARLRTRALRGLAQHECMGSLTKAVSHGVVRRRFCARCAHEDAKAFGETYWHRTHLLPGVYVCPKHRSPLAAMEGFLRSVAELRGIVMPDALAPSAALPTIPFSAFVAVARASVTAAAGPSLAARHQQFRVAALRLGYRLPGGDVACRPLARDLYQFYGGDFLKEAGCMFDPAARSPWPSLLVRPESHSVASTPKYILMDVFLRHCAPTELPVRAEYRKPGPAPEDLSKLDLRTAKRISGFLSRHARSQRRYSVQHLLQLTKAWSRFRHDRERFPATRQVLAEFKSSSQAERQAGRRPYWRRRLGLESISSS